LIHVVEDQLHPAFYNTQIWTVRDLIPDIEERALEELNVFYDETPGPNGVADMHVRYGHAAHGIIAYIKEQNPLLVVMATHGLRGIEHFLLGSVAEKVMRNVETPFLTVKAFGRSLLATAVSAEDALSES
jgi:nucleotide-binding universal stress UspA family protein